jgi:hypothetical protein
MISDFQSLCVLCASSEMGFRAKDAEDAKGKCWNVKSRKVVFTLVCGLWASAFREREAEAKVRNRDFALRTRRTQRIKG